MEDERITLRMGTEEVQSMDSFLEERPELGSRSQFIRTAVREYINRDAGVSAPSARPGVFVGLTETQMGALSALKESGRSYDDAEYIRKVLDRHFEKEDDFVNAGRDAYKVSTLEALKR